MTAPTTTDPDAAVIEPGEGGYPESPQPCQMGEHPAIKSILFRGEDAYVPVCVEHEDEARAALTEAGETVVGEVDIESDTADESGMSAALAVEPPPAEPAAVEVGTEVDGEMRVRFPVVVIEGMSTSDGRYLTPGGLTHRALPLSVLAQPESAHGGDDPGPAVIIGRLDTLTRTPGPELTSRRTGEPFPEGTFVWSGEGVIDATHPVADMVRRRYLRGVSVDLAGMDYEVIGDDQLVADSERPQRRIVAHSAEIGALTLVALPAFADAYVELADEPGPPEVVPPAEMPEGLVASATPAWRSVEVGDYPALVASADTWPAGVPSDAVEQLAAVIADDSGEQRDASELAAAIVEYIAAQWASGDTDSEMPDDMADVAGHEGSQGPGPGEYADPHVYARDPQSGAGNCVCGATEDDPLHVPVGMSEGMAAEVVELDEVGMPDAPQPCEATGESAGESTAGGDVHEAAVQPHPAARSLLYDDRKQYAATCAEHDEWCRGMIADLGFEVDEVVEILPDDNTDPDEIA